MQTIANQESNSWTEEKKDMASVEENEVSDLEKRRYFFLPWVGFWLNIKIKYVI